MTPISIADSAMQVIGGNFTNNDGGLAISGKSSILLDAVQMANNTAASQSALMVRLFTPEKRSAKWIWLPSSIWGCFHDSIKWVKDLSCSSQVLKPLFLGMWPDYYTDVPHLKLYMQVQDSLVAVTNSSFFTNSVTNSQVSHTPCRLCSTFSQHELTLCCLNRIQNMTYLTHASILWYSYPDIITHGPADIWMHDLNYALQGGAISQSNSSVYISGQALSSALHLSLITLYFACPSKPEMRS